MMRLTSLILSVLCFILLPAVATAQGSDEDSKTKAVSQIFNAFPVEGKLKEIPQELHVQFSQNPFGMQASKNEQMMDLFLKAFATDSLLADARRTFQQHYNPTYADSTLQWINTGSTQLILGTKNEFYTLQGIRKRVVKKYELEQNPPTDERTKLIHSLANNISAAESEIEAQAIIFRALVSAFSELNDQQSFSEAQIDGFVNNYRSQIRPQIQQEVNRRLLLVYHGLENDDLKRYSSFYNTESGTWLNRTMAESIHSSYHAASNRFLQSVRKL